MNRDNRSRVGFIIGVACAALVFAAFTFIPRGQKVASPAPADSSFRRIAVDEMKQRYDRNDIIVIDVRDLDQYAAAHIPGAMQIPLSRIQGEIPYLPKGKTIVTYCTCPNEESSGEAVQILANGGISDAVALAGGLRAWEHAGYRLDTGMK